jgi:hypothetical protein
MIQRYRLTFLDAFGAPFIGLDYHEEVMDEDPEYGPITMWTSTLGKEQSVRIPLPSASEDNRAQLSLKVERL